MGWGARRRGGSARVSASEDADAVRNLSATADVLAEVLIEIMEIQDEEDEHGMLVAC